MINQIRIFALFYIICVTLAGVKEKRNLSNLNISKWSYTYKAIFCIHSSEIRGLCMMKWLGGVILLTYFKISYTFWIWNTFQAFSSFKKPHISKEWYKNILIHNEILRWTFDFQSHFVYWKNIFFTGLSMKIGKIGSVVHTR